MQSLILPTSIPLQSNFTLFAGDDTSILGLNILKDVSDDELTCGLNVAQVQLIVDPGVSFERMRGLGNDEHARRDAVLAQLVVERGQLRRIPRLVVVSDHLECGRPIGQIAEICAYMNVKGSIGRMAEIFKNKWVKLKENRILDLLIDSISSFGTLPFSGIFPSTMPRKTNSAFTPFIKRLRPSRDRGCKKLSSVKVGLRFVWGVENNAD